MDRTVALREQMNHGAKKRSPFLAVSLCLMVMISVYLTHNGGALYTWRLFSSLTNTFTRTNNRKPLRRLAPPRVEWRGLYQEC